MKNHHVFYSISIVQSLSFFISRRIYCSLMEIGSTKNIGQTAAGKSGGERWWG